MNIGFAQIDARADGLLLSIDCDEPNNLHNAEVIGRAKAEYLNRLLDLQNEIKRKYEPALIQNTFSEDTDMQAVDDKMAEVFNELRKEGVQNLWYD